VDVGVGDLHVVGWGAVPQELVTTVKATKRELGDVKIF